MSDKSKCDRVFRSNAKTSISNASFHSFNSRSDGLRCDFSTNKLKVSMSNTSFRNFNSRLDGLRCDFSRNTLKYSSYFPLQNLVTKTPLPEFFECLFDSTPSEVSAILCVLFGDPLRALFFKNRDFSCYGQIFVPIRGDL